jgi:hypothetical protein
MKQMSRNKQLYYLINHEWTIIMKPILLISTTLLILNLVLCLIGLPHTDAQLQQQPVPLHFEQLLSAGGILFVHLIALAAGLVVIAAGWYRMFAPVGSIYRLYRLPVGIRPVFAVRILTGAAALLFIQAAQLLAAVLAYLLIYRSNQRIEVLDQGLYLAFRRSAWLRLLLPMNLPDVVLVILIGLMLTSITLTAVQCMQRDNRRHLSAFACIGLIVLSGLAVRFGYRTLASYRTIAGQLLYLLPLLLCVAFLIFLNQRWLQRRELT